MPQYPSVLVAVGAHEAPKVPNQKYKNIFTEYNIQQITKVSDADFYNRVVTKPNIKDRKEFDIYGFLPGNCKYTYDYSIEHIVEFFQQHPKIEIVVCDIMTVYDTHSRLQYIQPEASNNIPFFIRDSLKNKINFVDEKLMLQTQLQNLAKQGLPIFHIASPLLSLIEGNA